MSVTREYQKTPESALQAAYARWLDRADSSLRPELLAMQHDEGGLADAFYRDLAFGTGGLRGIEVAVEPEQARPDGEFPTCPYPNPEAREALRRGLALCEAERPDLLLATDPDTDRVGVAVLHADEQVARPDAGVALRHFFHCAELPG